MSGYRSVALKKKDFSGYTLSGVGVGVNPPLALPYMKQTGTSRIAGAIKYGAPTAIGTGGAQPMSSIMNGRGGMSDMSANDKRKVKEAQTLHHHLIHPQKTLHELPIKHTKKKGNFMDIFERKK